MKKSQIFCFELFFEDGAQVPKSISFSQNGLARGTSDLNNGVVQTG